MEIKKISLYIQRVGKKKLAFLCVISLLLLISLIVYFFSPKSPEQQIKEVISKVGKLTVLPNEAPTVATVTDKNKLKEQPFFNQAENGDVVLIFPRSGKAILYRSAQNKIIDISTINIPTQKTSEPTPTTPPKVAIYNGTSTSGLARSTETQLKNKKININVTSVGNTKNDYTKTIVIDISKKYSATAKQIATELKGEVTSEIPTGEPNPKVDIMVIVGK